MDNDEDVLPEYYELLPTFGMSRHRKRKKKRGRTISSMIANTASDTAVQMVSF